MLNKHQAGSQICPWGCLRKSSRKDPIAVELNPTQLNKWIPVVRLTSTLDGTLPGSRESAGLLIQVW